MKYKGTIIGEASGSLASMVFSHNRGGQYIRQRTIPTNPNSEFQQAIRSIVSQLTSYWGSGLTEAQRLAWDAYAEAVPMLDPLGEPRNIGGLGHFNRSNVARLQMKDGSFDRIDVAPPEFNLGEFTAPGITSITATTKVAIVTFDPTDAWAAETGSAMLFYGSAGKSAATNFFKGPYRYCGSINGSAGQAPTSPQNMTLRTSIAAGQKAFLRCVVTRADGRMSSTFRGGKICI